MSKETFLYARKRGHSVVENALLDDVNLTGMAKYLLIQFCSHRQGDWKINMKDIIKRSKNGRDAHYTALKELIHNEYVARIQVMDKGIFQEQIYIFGQIKDDVKEMLEETLKNENFKNLTLRVEFGPPKVEKSHSSSDTPNGSEKPFPGNPDTVPERPKKGSERPNESEKPFPENPDTVNPNAEKPDTENQNITNNQGTNNQKTSNNMDIHNIDDDKRTHPSGGSATHNDEDINLIINTLREATKNDLNKRSFEAVLRKVMDKYNQGKIKSNFRDYFMTSLINKIEELEYRRIQENAKTARAPRSRKRIAREIQEFKPSKDIPLYNWLEED